MVKKIMFASACILVCGTALAASSGTGPAEMTATEFEASLKYQHGKIILPGGVATLQLSNNFRYLGPEDTERVLVQAWGNPPGNETKVGKSFIEDIVEQEQKAEVSHPNRLVREKFQLEYPANWNVDVNDEDYDPDHMFSIDSPGSAFVMFAMGSGQLSPEDNLQNQIVAFQRLMGTPAIRNFEEYGKFKGKGAVLQGRIMGVRTTVKVFSFSQNEMTVLIVQQNPDEDEKNVQDGLALIENSFSLRDSSEANR